MKKQTEITVLSETVRVQRIEKEEFISLTDIAKFRNPDAPADIIKNWLRSRSTIDLLGLWEKLNNPGFKLVEFDQFRFEAGENEFVLSPKKWIETTGAVNLNALFINEAMPQPERLQKLNRIAIEQMVILTSEHSRRLLGEGEGQ
jgi:hypothetical protein